MVVEPLLIISVTAFNLAVMTRCSGTDTLMFNTKFFTTDVQDVFLVGIDYVAEFGTIIGLQDLRLVSKVIDSPEQKVISTIATLFFIWI